MRAFNAIRQFYQCGITLLELMLALLLCSFIWSILLGIFINHHRSQQLQYGLQQIAYQATKSLHLMQSEIHQAGQGSCVALPGDKLVGNQHEFTVQYAKWTGVELLTETYDPLVITTTSRVKFAPGDVLLLSNCHQAEIIRVKQVSMSHGAQFIGLQAPLRLHFSRLTEISRLMIDHFYVAKTADRTTDGQILFALYMENQAHQKIRISEGVNDVHFNYYLAEGGRINVASEVDHAKSQQLLAVAMEVSIYLPPFKKTWYGFAVLS